MDKFEGTADPYTLGLNRGKDDWYYGEKKNHFSPVPMTQDEFDDYLKGYNETYG